MSTISSIPARLDRLPWSAWHWRVVIALGVHAEKQRDDRCRHHPNWPWRTWSFLTCGPVARFKDRRSNTVKSGEEEDVFYNALLTQIARTSNPYSVLTKYVTVFRVKAPAPPEIVALLTRLSRNARLYGARHFGYSRSGSPRLPIGAVPGPSGLHKARRQSRWARSLPFQGIADMQ